MVEFAIIGPITFLIVLGIIVVGLAVANQNLLSNAVRDSARAAAVCGSSLRDAQTQLPAAGSQPAQTCSWANFDTYTQARLKQLAGKSALSAPTGGTNCLALPSGAALICLYDATDTAVVYASNPLDSCKAGYKIDVESRYAQSLYLPAVGNSLGNNGSTTTRTLTADAESTCEQ
jgi:Flp pilus assembly protein TadG